MEPILFRSNICQLLFQKRGYIKKLTNFVPRKKVNLFFKVKLLCFDYARFVKKIVFYVDVLKVVES